MIIKQVHIESMTIARVYERVALDSSPVLSDVKMDEETGVMHVLTEQKVGEMGQSFQSYRGHVV